MAVSYTSPYVLGLAASTLVAAATGVYGWLRRAEPGGTPFAATMALVTLWTATYTLAVVTPQEGLRVVLERARWLGTAFVGVTWLVFALEYTGLEEAVTRRRVAALVVVPAAAVVGVWTNPLHELFWTGYRIERTAGLVILVEEWGPLFWAFLAYTYVLVLLGTGLLLRAGLTQDDLYTDQSVALVVGALLPTVVSAVATLDVVKNPAVAGLDLTPYAFAVSGAVLGHAFVRYRLFDLVPATRRIGRDAVVRNMRDGVVVLDDDDEVVDANPVAQRAFDRERGELVGEHAGDVLPGVEPGPEGWEGEVQADGGRTFEVHASPMLDRRGTVAGTILVLRDVTDRRTREQRLTVLNRVLRHNFRNDMNAIDGYATMLAEGLDEPEASTARQIREVSEEVIDLADKARDIEQLMARREQDPMPVDPRELLDGIAADVRGEFPDVEVAVSGPDAEDVALPSQGILEPVLSNLVENAAEHNDAADPRVEVGIEVVAPSGDPDRRVAVTVADNGPGIPPQEREVLLSGTETALKHGSGLGLWLVYWGVKSLDGEVEFEDNDPRGSVVRVSVPLRAPTGGGDLEAAMGDLDDAIARRGAEIEVLSDG